VASVVSGETDWVLTPAPAAMSLVAGGRLRLLGHSMPVNTRPLGDTPSLALTVPGFEFAGWIGLLAPKGLPAAVALELGEGVAKVLRGPELLKAFETHGAVATASSPQDFRSFLERDIAQNRKAVEIAGIQPE
jgi:tripartite-type tricarboxylate transporter receptor subunit TctC